MVVSQRYPFMTIGLHNGSTSTSRDYPTLILSPVLQIVMMASEGFFSRQFNELVPIIEPLDNGDSTVANRQEVANVVLRHENDFTQFALVDVALRGTAITNCHIDAYTIGDYFSYRNVDLFPGLPQRP
jgi:hypothetical protein